MRSLPISAALIMGLGMCLIPAGDTAGKLLTNSFGVASPFVAWSRFAVGLILLMAILRRSIPFKLFRDWRIWLRGAIMASAISSILLALRSVPLADAFGAFFVGPTVSFFLSIWFLKEPFDWRRFAWLAFGFSGVLLITRPGLGTDPGILFAVLAGCLYGCFLTTSRWLTNVAPPSDLLLSQLFVGAVLLAPIGVSQIPPMSWPVVGLTTASALLSGLGNLCIVIAYRKATATALAPLVYLQLIAATGLGFLIFKDFPDLWASLGLLVLLISGFGATLMKPAPEQNR